MCGLSDKTCASLLTVITLRNPVVAAISKHHTHQAPIRYIFFLSILLQTNTKPPSSELIRAMAVLQSVPLVDNCCWRCCRAADLGTHDYCLECEANPGCASILASSDYDPSQVLQREPQAVYAASTKERKHFTIK